ncbi:MAG: hypothetical protein H6658_19175 [Ardenticatenaceae bacterium]|nr:hypothetical protein [Ardenticatenaceae bacterium]
MDHPIISSAIGKARYNEMVQAADNYRRVKQLQQGNQSRPSTLTRFANFLASAAYTGKGSNTTNPVAHTS